MCRNIKTLFNFEPPATEDEIHASALQFVRKLSASTSRRRPMPRRSTVRLRKSRLRRGGCWSRFTPTRRRATARSRPSGPGSAQSCGSDDRRFASQTASP